MIEIMATEHMTHEESKKYCGEWVDDKDYDIVHASENEDVVIYKPEKDLFGNYSVLAGVKKKAYTGDSYTEIRDCLMSIEDSTDMRSNAAGPIDPEEMKSAGMIEGVDYKLRTKNSFYTKKKNGEWGMIAKGNEIHSIMVGYKRGRFTGEIDLSGWAKNNPDRFEILSKIPEVNDVALKALAPDNYTAASKFSNSYILPEHRIGDSIYTTLSPNRYTQEGSPRMSYHIDSGDLEEGLTTMAIFKEGNISGNYLVFPRYRIAVDRGDGDVVIGDSTQVHGVTPIIGDGIACHCICYVDKRLATVGERGRSEGFTKKEVSTLDSFF